MAIESREVYNITVSKKREILCIALMFTFLVGVNTTDRTGVYSGGGYFTASNLVRLAIFSAAALYLYIFRIKEITKILTRPFIYLSGFYLFSLISIYYNSRGHFGFGDMIYVYSIGEWIVLITLASYLINSPKYRGFCGAVQVFKLYFKYLSISLPLLVLVASVIRPDLAFFPVPGWTLGGFMIHPNKLSIVCALGICVWMSEEKSPFRVWISIGLFVIALLTGSRSGSLLSAFALLHGFGSILPRRIAPPLYMLMVACLLATLLLIINGSGGVLAAQSGELTNLNGRDAVWRATHYMVSQKPILGWGWLEGPAQLGRYTGEDWWFSRNAQNDVLNFTVSSGIAAGLVSAYFYLRTLATGVRYEFDRSYRMLFSASVVVFFSSMVEPISSNLANMVGFALIFLILISFKKRKIQRPIKEAIGEVRPRMDQKFRQNYVRHAD